MLDIDKFIAIVEEDGALWDKNEVARAWKKVNQVLKNCAIKSQSVNSFWGGKMARFGYDFTA